MPIASAAQAGMNAHAALTPPGRPRAAPGSQRVGPAGNKPGVERGQQCPPAAPGTGSSPPRPGDGILDERIAEQQPLQPTTASSAPTIINSGK